MIEYGKFFLKKTGNDLIENFSEKWDNLEFLLKSGRIEKFY